MKDYRYLVRRYKPRGYKLVRLHPNAKRHGTEGQADVDAKTIEMDDELSDPWRWLVFLHECGHVHCGHGNGKPHWREEYEAWRWAIKVWADEGFILPRPLLHEIKQRIAREFEASGDVKMWPDGVAYWVYGKYR